MATENGSQDIAEAAARQQQPAAKASTGAPAAVPKGTKILTLMGDGTNSVVAVAEAARNQICRNLYIHGECKFQGKGCAFRHDVVCRWNPQTEC